MNRYQRLIKKFFICLLFLLALKGIDALVHKHDRGFSLANISSDRSVDPRWSLPPLSEDEERQILKILNQKFTYFDKGIQSYVCLSEDKKYVLKFLKEHSLRPRSWLAYLPIKTAVRKDYARRQFSEWKVLTSMKNAALYFKEETGVVYVHLNKTKHLKQKVTVLSKRKKPFSVDLDQVTFVLQKRAERVYPKLLELIEQGNIETARHLLTSLLQLLYDFNSRGVKDNDPVIKTNFGVIGEKIIQIDVGSLLLGRPKSAKKVMTQVTRPLDEWLLNHHPPLLEFFKSEKENILKGANIHRS